VKDKQALARILAVVAGIAVASALHYMTSPSLRVWHYLFQRLYYLPIIYAAIYFGWRGGLASSSASGICYIPHIRHAWHTDPNYAMIQYAEIIVFFLVGGVTGVLSDIGRRQRMQLMASSAKLAKLNRELQDSFEQVKRADRLSAIGQLSANLAHEIRNPLASIDGAANLIESEQTPEPMRKDSLRIIRKEVQRLNTLLTGLLDFARPRRPEFQVVDAGRLIDPIIGLATHSAERKGITLVKRIAVPAPAFECDPEQMKQVLLNLAINAVQSMDAPGEIVISARTERGCAVISVRDRGAGIKEEDVDQIFNPFFTTKETGTGLGLSVVHQIVTQHKGTVTAARNHDGGMTFSVEIPLSQKEQA
jgi:two-component system, NtrC family, sensor histidine kinase HydH